jgi:hypothetical protein
VFIPIEPKTRYNAFYDVITILLQFITILELKYMDLLHFGYISEILIGFHEKSIKSPGDRARISG